MEATRNQPLRAGPRWASRAVALGAALLVLRSLAAPFSPVRFGSPKTFRTGDVPSSLATGDLDRDGKPDVVVADRLGANLCLGVGDGTVLTPRRFPGATHLSVGDFNNDGVPDVLSAGYYALVVLMGDGKGGVSATNTGRTYYPRSLGCGDFNGDGNLDMAEAMDSGRELSVGFGTGSGAFGAWTNWTLATRVGDMVIRDCNADGRPDLVFSLRRGANANSFGVITNGGGGRFGPPEYYVGASADDHDSLVLEDFNHDGEPDLAVLNYNACSVTIRLNTGAGRFGPGRDYAVTFGPIGIAAADFSGDGTPDLIVRGGSTAAVLVGYDDGAFKADAVLSVPGIAGSVGSYGSSRTVVAADFNCDGLPDIALTGSQDCRVMLNETQPALEITRVANHNQITWLGLLDRGFTLEWTTNSFAPGSWQAFPYPPVTMGNLKAVADWSDGETKLYRLRKP